MPPGRVATCNTSPVTSEKETKVVDPDYEHFSGFVFKLQANLDPKHRDRMVSSKPLFFSSISIAFQHIYLHSLNQFLCHPQGVYSRLFWDVSKRHESWS